MGTSSLRLPPRPPALPPLLGGLPLPRRSPRQTCLCAPGEGWEGTGEVPSGGDGCWHLCRDGVSREPRDLGPWAHPCSPGSPGGPPVTGPHPSMFWGGLCLSLWLSGQGREEGDAPGQQKPGDTDLVPAPCRDHSRVAGFQQDTQQVTGPGPGPVASAVRPAMTPLLDVQGRGLHRTRWPGPGLPRVQAMASLSVGAGVSQRPGSVEKKRLDTVVRDSPSKASRRVQLGHTPVPG